MRVFVEKFGLFIAFKDGRIGITKLYNTEEALLEAIGRVEAGQLDRNDHPAVHYMVYTELVKVDESAVEIVDA